MPLDPARRKQLERQLLESRERVVQALARSAQDIRGALREESGDVSSFRLHLADLGTDTADQELDAANAARLTGELAEIDAALERLYQRPLEYGTCERGGEPTPFARLELVPWARTCREHSG
jgi:RNA polymerase-binding transcription factor DksA